MLILNKAEGAILLQHRTKDAPTFPEYWSLFGGGIEEGETPEQAVRREILEELGYELSSPRLFTVQQIAHDKVHVFVERYDGRPLVLREGQARARNGLNSDSLPPLFGQRAGVPLRCVMERPYGGNYAQEDHPELYALSIGARRS